MVGVMPVRTAELAATGAGAGTLRHALRTLNAWTLNCDGEHLGRGERSIL